MKAIVRWSAPLRFLTVIFLLSIGGAGPGRAQPVPAAQIAALQHGLAQIQSEFGATQVLFRLERPGQPGLEAGAGGFAPGSRVAVGSLSKSITATGIALLIQRGQLRLDSRLGDLLPAYFARHGATLDPSLQPVTVERLLTHRAGLRQNAVNNPSGLSSGRVIQKIGGGADFFQYPLAFGDDKSDGTDNFVYSNLSYLFLGEVIEAVSGRPYEEFFQHEVFAPLGIQDAAIPSGWQVVAPFGAWHMSLASLLKVWSVFDIQHPSLLTAATLQRTLLGHLGKPPGATPNVFYTLGAYVRQDSAAGGYVASHNGISDFIRSDNKYYTFVEKVVPGDAWAIELTPMPEPDQRQAMVRRVRQLVEDVRSAR